MRQLLRRLAVTALLAPVAALGAATMTASPASAAAASPQATVAEQALQNEINDLINVERVRGGCSALTVNAQLTEAARAHSEYMAQTGAFSHTGRGGSRFGDRVKATGYAKPSAENIAWGYRTASAVVGGWMTSPGHRTNILNCKSTSAGVGVVFAANGAPYYTQDFGY
ncbi:CAP domain-containing protein [Actinoplanes derwentensis]|uniref:Uncharacterized conserved protein YkwD, contains CAP (CSP/antigen 5/PR1) domain n=1 Tax=Actinoplanes derwentensis TaxID=113562 RepID=A0A1H1VVG3_9ACTN|nr:CAP domain-containing protein [Actinoplanes derwentensis]GID83961.1 hypothetical protein Ade03nite_28850 [Actinoplanes derwentensis]SDS88887.1 Uncharacterized conserved protein YkwD, contains CAP (CSP/antigen 5/PR1) domain [Actinoplanes derwentensis]